MTGISNREGGGGSVFSQLANISTSKKIRSILECIKNSYFYCAYSV